jgi:hypothetical protein
MGAIPALIALSALWLQNAIATIISFAAIGIYMSFPNDRAGGAHRAREGLAPERPLHAGGWGYARQRARARSTA